MSEERTCLPCGNKVVLVYQWPVNLGAAPFGIIKDDTLRLNDVITDCINLKLSGTATDNVIQCFGGNILRKEKPVLAIEVSSKEILLWILAFISNNTESNSLQ